MSHGASPESLDQLRVFQLEPNLTVILPGRCQARCPFCVEPESKQQALSEVWLQSFQRLIEDELPPVFKVLTLSGGEPSLSPVFPDLLRFLVAHRASGRLKRVVLTTNGCSKPLEANLELLGRAVTHINISRHAVEDGANTTIFKTDQVPSHAGLANLITRANQAGLPVNLNCVHSSKHAFGRRIDNLSRGELRAEAMRFVRFARELGASSVVFRNDHRVERLEGVDELEEALSDYATIHRASCDSCRVAGKFIQGLPVNFKRSVYEPCRKHYAMELYELIFHSDASLCRDWSRQHPLARPLPRSLLSQDWSRLSASREASLALPPQECDDRQNTCNMLTFSK